MPPATYEAALNDVGFLSMLGSIYQQANQFDVAQNLLERSARLQIAAGGQPSIPLQVQLAGIYLQRNNTDQAYNIYRQVLTAHPERVDAWKGLISTLQVTNRTNEALQQIALIPPAVRKQLEADPEFVQSEASLYAAAGDTAQAIEYMNRVQAHYAQLKQAPPPNIEIQNAWLLYNTKNDRALYPTLMKLGGRQDLTPAQRETVQTIWANWSVRRAGAALENNDNQRAVDILEAASLAFPDNMTVRKVLAGGYVRTGQIKEALAIYKSVGMQDASAADFQGAVGAALAANDKALAEAWLRQALDRFPNDASVLAMAARFELARGDKQRAADYWRASIAAMPATSPTDRLAHELAYPDVSNKPHKARTTAELQQLLNPENEPFAKTTKLPPLPAYGPDPYNGRPPVVLAQPQPTAQQQQEPMITAPATTQIPSPIDARDQFHQHAPAGAHGKGAFFAGGQEHKLGSSAHRAIGPHHLFGKSGAAGREHYQHNSFPGQSGPVPANSGLHSATACGYHSCTADTVAALDACTAAVLRHGPGFGATWAAAHYFAAHGSQGRAGAGAIR